VLGQSTWSFGVPALPTGKVLYATLLIEVDGYWTRYQAAAFEVT